MISRIHNLFREIRHDCAGREKSIFFICLMGMFLLASYAIARPGIESLFIEKHGSAGLPAVWVTVAIMAVVVVRIYNGFAYRFDFKVLYLGGVGAFSLLFVVLMCGLKLALPGSIFALYVWKDIYIVVLIEIFWSLANVLFETKSARWTYGIFLIAGSIGTKSALKLNNYVFIDAFGLKLVLYESKMSISLGRPLLL